jgi:hypothetical protein
MLLIFSTSPNKGRIGSGIHKDRWPAIMFAQSELSTRQLGIASASMNE